MRAGYKVGDTFKSDDREVVILSVTPATWTTFLELSIRTGNAAVTTRSFCNSHQFDRLVGAWQLNRITRRGAEQ